MNRSQETPIGQMFTNQITFIKWIDRPYKSADSHQRFHNRYMNIAGDWAALILIPFEEFRSHSGPVSHTISIWFGVITFNCLEIENDICGYFPEFQCVDLAYLFVAFKHRAFECIRTAISCNITKYFEIAAIVWNVENPINWMIR